MDAVTWFLYGELTEEIIIKRVECYMKTDDGDLVRRLKKIMHRLKKSPHVWYYALNDLLTSIRLKLANAHVFLHGRMAKLLWQLYMWMA